MQPKNLKAMAMVGFAVFKELMKMLSLKIW